MHLPKMPKIPKVRRIKKSNARLKAGLPPGTLIHTGQKLTSKNQVDLISYDKASLIEIVIDSPEEISAHIDDKKVNWVNIDGLHNIELIREVGKCFNLDPLVLEDIVNTDQRPKIEETNGMIFFPMKALNTLSDGTDIQYEQISFIMGDHFILSFQEKEGDMFDGLRNRIKDSKNRVRNQGSDYLFYRLIDTVVDNYFLVMDVLGDRVENIEEEVYFNPSNKTMQRIQDIKKELIFLRRSLYPIREAISHLMRNELQLIKKENRSYFSDVYDHTIQLIESFESYRDMISNLMDMYMSTISNKMNEIMKVLTIISTIFIPLSFVAGVYGMNFTNMPELQWRYGYFAVLGVMMLLSGSMLYYFRKKRWL